MTPGREGRGNWPGAASWDQFASLRVASRVGDTRETPAREARQIALPTLPAITRTGPNVVFAHPAEQELARLLTFYGVRWSYEPTMFALAGRGEPPAAAFFTPDFYLPDHNLYLELTTMRQRLVTRKNRKLRLVRERYPGVAIKLLYRRDYQRLIDAYVPIAGAPILGDVLATASELAARIEVIADALAAQLTADRTGGLPLVLACGAGAGRFHADLSQALRVRGCDLHTGRVTVSRYHPAATARTRVTITAPVSVTGQRVVVIHDVVSSGLSLDCVTGWLRRHGVASVTNCALLERPAARLLPGEVAHVALSNNAPLVAGFGLRRYPALGRRPDLVTLAAPLPDLVLEHFASPEA